MKIKQLEWVDYESYSIGKIERIKDSDYINHIHNCNMEHEYPTIKQSIQCGYDVEDIEYLYKILYPSDKEVECMYGEEHICRKTCCCNLYYRIQWINDDEDEYVNQNGEEYDCIMNLEKAKKMAEEDLQKIITETLNGELPSIIIEGCHLTKPQYKIDEDVRWAKQFLEEDTNHDN